ncbi:MULTISPECIES: TrmB family transcriptional regulator [Halolamina]|uniref:Sugar-specific transcriptional regulator TrmB n=1 Tax=Halolamina pelagica TaxID=699431 RepID=A0A1I5M0F2_9EURY|nr:MULTISPECIES: helix-turn-helix domain-containing protein [Halolamina]NHX35791.1 TrmB family transcriptional regulator [Halolamina sp. R1-12]SFP02877.1 Sugar-specific transcriptional regulator TrmB [Halolamina pelagica]
MDDADAAAALTELGLSTYAARTFVGLQKLGVASASEIAQVADVPRSQVYGAADELEELGLIDVQEGSPTRYRPVDIDEARELLYDRLHSTTEGAFDHLETVRGQQAPTDDREAIWTTEGRENVTARVTSLVAGADERVLFATSRPSLLSGDVADGLADADAAGVDVIVASADAAVREAASEAGLSAVAVADATPELSVGRVLLVDDDTVLLSVRPTAEMQSVADESAFWSDGTGFARVLAAVIRQAFV